jgi:hypothetical protein
VLSTKVALGLRPKVDEVESFWGYLAIGAPTVLVISLPSRGPWGKTFDKLGYQAARYQTDCGRHFVAERGRVGSNKMFKSSSPELLHDVQIHRNAWHTVRNNIAQFIMDKRHAEHVEHAFPMTEGGGAPSERVEEIGEAAPSERVEEIGEACPGCNQRRVSTDPQHTRVPGVCRYPHVETQTWKCPACISHLPAHDERHTKVDGECRAAQMKMKAFGRRKQNEERTPQPRADGLWCLWSLRLSCAPFLCADGLCVRCMVIGWSRLITGMLEYSPSVEAQ